MMRHLRKCKLQHPPGDEIYRRHYAGGRSVSMFEVRPPLHGCALACVEGLRCACAACCPSAGGCSVFVCEIWKFAFSQPAWVPGKELCVLLSDFLCNRAALATSSGI